MHDRLLDREVEQEDAIGQVAERYFRRAHQPNPNGQIGHRKGAEIGRVGDLQQEGRRDGCRHAENGRIGDSVAIEVQTDPGEEREDQGASGLGADWIDRTDEEGAGSGGEGEQHDQRNEDPSILQRGRQGEDHEREVTLKLEWNGPELRVDHARNRIVFEHAGQGKVHQADNIAEITAEFRTRQVLPEREGGEQRTEDQRGERDLEGESGNQPQGAKRDKLMQAGSRQAPGDEKPRQGEEHRQDGCEEETKRPAPQSLVFGGGPRADDQAVPDEHGERQSNSQIIKSGRGAGALARFVENCKISRQVNDTYFGGAPRAREFSLTIELPAT